MLIDWFTVIAQAINFIILVWLMKRFLYKPIQGAIDEREKRIAAELASADRKKADAQKESDEFRRKNKEFDEQRAALLTKVKEEIEIERERLLANAQKAAETLSSKHQETLKNEEHNLHQSIIHRIQQEVFAITKKMLTDLAETSLEDRMVDLFIRRLREEKEQLTAVIGASSSPVIVRTTLDLSKSQRAGVEAAIKETLGTQMGIKFEIAPELISGIELTTNGQKVAWSVADYLTLLENSITELLNLNEQNKPEEPQSATRSP